MGLRIASRVSELQRLCSVHAARTAADGSTRGKSACRHLRNLSSALATPIYFSASGCLDSTPLNVATGNLHPAWRCKCSMWARAPVEDCFNACTGPWQYLQRIGSLRSVSASKRVHGSQRPRTLTSHSVITGGFFFVGMDWQNAPKCGPTRPCSQSSQSRNQSPLEKRSLGKDMSACRQ